MSAVTSIGRLSVTTSLKLARIPFDLAGRVLGLRTTEVDNADARLRTSAGSLLGDETLAADGRRRGAAAKQRERAVRLRADADRREAAARKRAVDESENLGEAAGKARLEALERTAGALDEAQAAQTASDE